MRTRRCTQGQRGYVLLLALVFLVIGALVALVNRLDVIGQRVQRDEGTQLALERAREALIGYAATFRDKNSGEVFGYLPCPDVDGDGSADALDASCGGTDGRAVVGLLPYQTLGLPDLRDSSGACLWYAVSGRYKASSDGLTLPRPLNWDTQGQFAIAGTLIAPDSGDGGAAAVIVATGAPLAGQTRGVNSTTPCGVVPSEVAAYIDEAFPGGSGQITLKPAGSIANSNDRMLAVTPREIFDRVVKRADFTNALTGIPAGHINKLIDEIKASLEQKIQADLVAGASQTDCTPVSLTSAPGNCTSYTQYPEGSSVKTKLVGDLTSGLTVDSGAYANYLANWTEQFRQVISSGLTTSLSINGTPCRGALLFGGRDGSGRPRTSAQKSPSTGNLQHYFETATALLGTSDSFLGRAAFAESVSIQGATWSGGSATLTVPSGHGFSVGNSLTVSGIAPAGYNGTFQVAAADATHISYALSANPGPYSLGGTAYSLSADVATCLFPGAFVSFAQDIAAFQAGTVTAGSTMAAAVDTGAKAVTLGTSVAGGVAAACSWYPTALPMGSILRVYFRYQMVDVNSGQRGPGFTMALADAATNANAAITKCGGGGSEYLGYAGTPPGGQVTGSMGMGTPVAITGASVDSAAGSCSAKRARISVASHPFMPDDFPVAISGVIPNGYNISDAAIESATSTALWYCVPSDPGSSGIKPPKLALEFDTKSQSSQLDPSANHFAFVYWGSADDSGPSGSGEDDNAHFRGIAGSGTEPLNPRALGSSTPTATPIALISGASWDGANVAATTHGLHGFADGQTVRVADVTPTAYEGRFQVNVASLAQFGYSLAANPGTYAYGSSASRTSAVVSIAGGTLTTALPHGFAAGKFVNISGVASAVGCNGLFEIASTPPPPISFTLTSYSGACTGTGYATATNKISGATWSLGKATVTTTAAHGLVTGQYVAISDIYPHGYNGTHAVTVTDGTHFTYDLATDPGGSYSGSALPGIVTATSLGSDQLLSDSPVPFTSTPIVPYNADSAKDGVIHVRLDVSRTYDPTRKQAILNMKAYIGDRFFENGNTCSIGDFKNLSRNLSDLQCQQQVAIRQDGIVVNDVNGPAMENVYFGFTTARSSSSADNQSVTISNLQVRSQ